MKTRTHKNWWLLTIKSFLSFYLGFSVLLTDKLSLIVLNTQIILFIAGLTMVVAAVYQQSKNPDWPIWMVEGIFDFIIALTLSVYPGITIPIYALIFSLWALMLGTVRFVGSFTDKKAPVKSQILRISGFLFIFLGGGIMLNPIKEDLSTIHIIAIFGFVYGCLTFIVSIWLKIKRNRDIRMQKQQNMQ